MTIPNTFGQSDVTLLPPSFDPLREVLSVHNLSPVEAELVSEIQARIGPAWRAHSQSRAVLHRTVVQTFEALRQDNRFIYIKGFLSECQSRLAEEVGISKGYYSKLKKAVAFYQELEATEASHCLELYRAMSAGAQYVFATLPKEQRDKLFHGYLCKKEVPTKADLEELQSVLNPWRKKPAEKFPQGNSLPRLQQVQQHPTQEDESPSVDASESPVSIQPAPVSMPLSALTDAVLSKVALIETSGQLAAFEHHLRRVMQAFSERREQLKRANY